MINKEEKYLKIFEILHRRTLEENEEFYKINSIFLTLLTGISGFGLYIESLQEPLLRLGLVISVFWFCSNFIQVMWKRWWQGKYEKVETIVFDTKELQDLKKEGELNKPKILVPLRLTFTFLLLPVIFTVFSILGLGLSNWLFALAIIQIGIAWYAAYRYFLVSIRLR